MASFLITISNDIYERWEGSSVSVDLKLSILKILENALIDSLTQENNIGIIVKTKPEVASLEILSDEEFEKRTRARYYTS